MKTCSYCGRDNPDENRLCHECGSEILSPEPEASLQYPETVKVSKINHVDLGAVEGAFEFEEGFSRPNWEVIRQRIEEVVAPENRGEAWSEAALQWVCQLRDELGGDYHVTESNDFILLCALDKRDTEKTHQFLEETWQVMRTYLSGVASTDFYGKGVVLVFIDHDDYYQYQSPILREGVNVATGGVFLTGGYSHIALPYCTEISMRQTLVHELAHESLAHLPLPLWLNEGVARTLERMLTRQDEPVLHQELADQHRNYWTEENIQDFWAGTSFEQPGEAQTLSYSLAEIIVQLLTSEGGDLKAFLRQASYVDAGQTAALDCFGCSLGDVLMTFLGPGEWRPVRKALVEAWEQEAKKETESEEGNPS